MHLSIRRAKQNHTQKLPHINKHTFMKFVIKFVKLINEKSSNVHENHCAVQQKELQQEKIVLEERLKSIVRILLVEIGQDMVTAEQKICAHKSQTRRTVQLKRLLPE
ncbi:unnamed protein product [Adineta steineri]|nr:unnamed protein product [Adineta steineri]CAF0747147.1 unnamed protein product [Adineta steineri]